jgi:hypothetical protein
MGNIFQENRVPGWDSNSLIAPPLFLISGILKWSCTSINFYIIITTWRTGNSGVCCRCIKSPVCRWEMVSLALASIILAQLKLRTLGLWLRDSKRDARISSQANSCPLVFAISIYVCDLCNSWIRWPIRGSQTSPSTWVIQLAIH